MSTAFIGQPVSRVDGRRKVTGTATYAAEFQVPGVAHGAIVRSTVANGRIASINTEAAERASGVIAIVTHRNAPRLSYRPHKGAPDPRVGERLHMPQDDRGNPQGQPIGLGIWNGLEQGIHPASLRAVPYAPQPGATEIQGREPVPAAQEQTEQ